MLRDLRLAIRNLTQAPAFSVAAIVSLALGIGAGSAIFTVADQVMMRPLPVRQPEQLVQFHYQGLFIGGRSMCSHEDEKKTFSYPQYLDLRNGNPGVMSGIAAQRQWPVDLADRGPAERAMAELVSGNYFQVAGVDAALGRTLTPEDDRVRNGEPYIVLSYAFWQSRFGGDPSVLNRELTINGRRMTVVGVAAKGFWRIRKDESCRCLHTNDDEDGGHAHMGRPRPPHQHLASHLWPSPPWRGA